MIHNKLRLILYPSFVGKLLNKKIINSKQLLDPRVLANVLSTHSLNKIKYLNSSALGKDKCADLLNLSVFSKYVTNNSFNEIVKTNTPMYAVGNILTALTEPGEEKLVPEIEKQLYMYHLPFTFYKIDNKCYGIVFKDLKPIDSPLERKENTIKDMDTFLTEVSKEVSDQDLLQEPIFKRFLITVS